MENNYIPLRETEFDKAYKILEASFPAVEIRNYEGQKRLLKKPQYELCGVKDKEGNVLAVIGAWESGDFIFIEHFAVDEMLRGKGLGAAMLQNFLTQKKKLAVLEVELPTEEIAKRRVGFYERLGFTYTEFGYMQPVLQEGMPAIPLQLMSWPRPIIEGEFKAFYAWLMKHVYQAQ